MSKKISRRDFLKSAGIASAGLMFTAVGMNPKSYARIIGANDRVNVGVVGYSGRFRGSLLPVFRNNMAELNFDMIGCSDIWRLRREAAKQKLEADLGHAIRLYRNNEELYDDKDIDAVIISTADFQHALHAAEAANAGKDMYVEKPFAETMDDAKVGRQAVERAGVIFQMGSQRRSGANYHAANEFIRSGKFGDIVYCEMSWNVNQPGRWRLPDVVPTCKEEDTDWNRFLMNRPYEPFDPRKYCEFRLFWPYSSGIPGQWMAHQIDTVHWFTGLHHPRSATANAGIYQWNDGRTNADTMTAVLDYGPTDDLSKGFQVVYTSRFTNSAGGTKELYYSNGGELNLLTNKVTSNGGLTERNAAAMGLKANLLDTVELKNVGPTSTEANTGGDNETNNHMRNWMECIRSRKQTNAPVEAAYDHTAACVMANAAIRTKEYVTFDEERQEVMAGGKVFKY